MPVHGIAFSCAHSPCHAGDISTSAWANCATRRHTDLFQLSHWRWPSPGFPSCIWNVVLLIIKQKQLCCMSMSQTLLSCSSSSAMQQDAPLPMQILKASFGLSTKGWAHMQNNSMCRSVQEYIQVAGSTMEYNRRGTVQDPFKLHISPASTSGPERQTDVTLSFVHALLPHVAIEASTVYALTAGGFLHSIALPDKAEGQQNEVISALTDLNSGKRAAMRLADIAILTHFPGAAQIFFFGWRKRRALLQLLQVPATLCRGVPLPQWVMRLAWTASDVRSLAGCRISAAGGTHSNAARGQAHLHRHPERRCAGHAAGLSTARQHRLCRGPEAHCRHGAPPDQLFCQVLPLHPIADSKLLPCVTWEDTGGSLSLLYALKMAQMLRMLNHAARGGIWVADPGACLWSVQPSLLSVADRQRQRSHAWHQWR